MYRTILANRWFALLWAALTLGSAVAFISEGGGQAKLDQAIAELRARQQPKPLTPPAPRRIVEVEAEEPEDALLIEEEEAGAASPAATPGKTAKLVDPASEGDEAETYVVIDQNQPVVEASDEDLLVKP